MTVQFLLVFVLVGLLLPAIVGPRVLRSAAPLLSRIPRVAVGLLTASVVFWVLAALSIGPLLAWLVTGPALLPENAAAVCSRCLAAADPFGLDRVDTVIPVVLLLIVPVAVSGAHGIRVVKEMARRRRATLRAAARWAGRGRQVRLRGFTVQLVHHAHPFAMALPRRHRGIIVSSAAIGVLSEQELAAVLAHEDAHLRQRHHLVAALVSTLTTGLRWVPLFAAVDAALGHYLEIAADDSAQRQVGTPALAAALLTLGQYGRLREYAEEPRGVLHALGPDRISHLVQPARGTRGLVAALTAAMCLASLAVLAAVVHVPYVLAVATGCF